MATKQYKAGTQDGGIHVEVDAEEGEFPRLAAEGLKGLLRMTGYAALAMIAGYSAGFAMSSYQETRGRHSATPGH